MMVLKKEWPNLYHKGKGGELRVWKIWTKDDTIYTSYGVKDGEMQTASKRATPKNVGRSNETTAEDQAVLEAQSMYTFKLERKYSETEEEAQDPLMLPMLAKEYKADKVSFPVAIQPKLDGCRALAFWENGKVKLISRAGKEWTIPSHINEALETILPKDTIFDGELYVHGQSCQTITSWIKKLREETLQVEYHVYDIPIIEGAEDMPSHYRMGYLLGTASKHPNHKYIKFVTTHLINTEEEIKEFENKVVAEGYEGAIVRNWDGIYTFGYRSQDLMKVKTFQDSEFEVLAIREGIGKFEGHAVFICQNDLNEKTFECTIASSMEERKKMYDNKDNYIGERLTVKYFHRTDDLVPRFPVGLRFRPEEDLDAKT